MRRIASLSPLITLVAASLAFAHTRLDGSTPADGDEVASPDQIVLDFSEPVHVTAVVLQTAVGAEQPIGEIPAGPAESFAIPVTGALASGEYVVSWRAVSADTHIVSGEFSFVVAADD